MQQDVVSFQNDVYYEVLLDQLVRSNKQLHHQVANLLLVEALPTKIAVESRMMWLEECLPSRTKFQPGIS